MVRANRREKARLLVRLLLKNGRTIDDFIRDMGILDDRTGRRIRALIEQEQQALYQEEAGGKIIQLYPNKQYLR